MNERVIKLTVNGEPVEVMVAPRVTLLEAIRDKLELTGTKEACSLGECGACTVILEGKAVNSCLVLAVEANGKQILTIEGLSKDGHLHPLQRAFIDEGAVQCGFCTPGMILSAKALLDKNPEPDEDDIKEALAGNLCRCTGYIKIVRAVKVAAQAMKNQVK